MLRYLISPVLLLTLLVPPGSAPNIVGREQQSSSARSQKPASLPRSSPERQGISSAGILAFIEAADEEIDTMNSFMLIRHGQVVAEGWWTPYDRETPHVLYSLSKSFTSTAVGLAIADGKLSLDDQVLKFFPDDAPLEPSANLRAMRVSDLLRMSSGNQTEAFPLVDDQTKERIPWTKLFLNHPVPFKPGTHFLYNSPGTYMLSAIVQKVTGMTLLDYLRPKLFEPLGFKDPVWLSSPQGISIGAYGLSARTEEIARFGQLYLQKGRWNGKQLVPAAWVEQATKLQTANGSAPASDWDQGYGYQFWRSRHNSFRGDGAFGQYCMVLPDQDSVIVITSGVRDMQQVMNLVWDKLLPAMKKDPLPDDAPARQKLEAKLATLQVKFPVGAPSSRLSSQVNGKSFAFPDNDRGIKSVSFDFNSGAPSLLVRTSTDEIRTPIGIETWTRSRGSFTNGLDHFLSVPPDPLVAASGAWTTEDTFSVKIVLYETPFYTNLNFKFAGDKLTIDSEANVAFGSARFPQLDGKAISQMHAAMPLP